MNVFGKTKYSQFFMSSYLYNFFSEMVSKYVLKFTATQQHGEIIGDMFLYFINYKRKLTLTNFTSNLNYQLFSRIKQTFSLHELSPRKKLKDFAEDLNSTFSYVSFMVPCPSSHGCSLCPLLSWQGLLAPLREYRAAHSALGLRICLLHASFSSSGL
jgi:hypothetical protein